MKFIILGLPRSHHLKSLVLDQFRRTDHSFVVFEERGRDFIDGGWSHVAHGDRTAVVLFDRFDDDRLADAAGEYGAERIISLSDRTARLAARLRLRCSVPGPTEHVENRIVDKSLMRELLLARGLSRIGSRRTTVEALPAVLDEDSYPCVVKPSGLGASLCVELLRGPADVEPYTRRCRSNRVFDDEELVVEDYVPGPELSVEGIIADGAVTFYGITESHHSGEPYFVGTGHDFFPIHEQAGPITAFVERIIDALEMDDCLFHIELKCLSTGYEVIEVHSRFGGTLIAELVRLGTGAEVFADHVRALAGEPARTPRPRAGLYGQHMLCSAPGRIRTLELSDDVTTDPRVLAHGLDHGPGDVVEADVLPVQYVGHVIFATADRAGAADVRTRCDRGLTIELDTVGPVAGRVAAVTR